VSSCNTNYFRFTSSKIPSPFPFSSSSLPLIRPLYTPSSSLPTSHTPPSPFSSHILPLIRLTFPPFSFLAAYLPSACPSPFSHQFLSLIRPPLLFVASLCPTHPPARPLLLIPLSRSFPQFSHSSHPSLPLIRPLPLFLKRFCHEIAEKTNFIKAAFHPIRPTVKNLRKCGGLAHPKNLQICALRISQENLRIYDFAVWHTYYWWICDNRMSPRISRISDFQTKRKPYLPLLPSAQPQV
jgi:hypothetical protein